MSTQWGFISRGASQRAIQAAREAGVTFGIERRRRGSGIAYYGRLPQQVTYVDAAIVMRDEVHSVGSIPTTEGVELLDPTQQ